MPYIAPFQGLRDPGSLPGAPRFALHPWLLSRRAFGATDKLVLLVDRRDGKPLSGQEGPLRIIVPDEKRHARWVRQIISLVVKGSS